MKHFILGVLLLMPANAMAAEWIPIADGADGTRVFVDGNSVVHTGQSKRFWLKFNYAAVKSVPHREAISLNKIDCINHTYWVVSRTNYNASGGVVYTDDRSNYTERFSPIIPDSIMDAVASTLCSISPSSRDSL